MSVKQLLILMLVGACLTKIITEQHYHYHFGNGRAHNKARSGFHLKEMAAMQAHFEGREREAGWLDLIKNQCNHAKKQDEIANCAVGAVSDENCPFMLAFLKNLEIITEATYNTHLDYCKV